VGYLQDKQRTNKKKITTKPKLLAHLQNKRNQNGNRHKTKNKYSIKSKNKRQGIIELTYQIHMSRMVLKAYLTRDLNLSPNLNPLATNLSTHHTYNTEETCTFNTITDSQTTII
jgi:hypothetical protein